MPLDNSSLIANIIGLGVLMVFGAYLSWRWLMERQSHIERKIEHLTELQSRTEKALYLILEELRHTHWLLREILQSLPPRLNVTGFTDIKENTMPLVPLAAGFTATFATTPIPATSVPDPTKLVWISSDPVNAPVTPNTADPSGLSTLVAFPSTVVAGVTFSLTLSYTNSDGTPASQTNSYTTVAPPSPDITGFAPIAQTA